MASNNNLLGLEIETPETSLFEEIEENNDLLEESDFIVGSFGRNKKSSLKFAYIENCKTNKFLEVESPPPRRIDFNLKKQINFN